MIARRRAHRAIAASSPHLASRRHGGGFRWAGGAEEGAGVRAEEMVVGWPNQWLTNLCRHDGDEESRDGDLERHGCGVGVGRVCGSSRRQAGGRGQNRDDTSIPASHLFQTLTRPLSKFSQEFCNLLSSEGCMARVVAHHFGHRLREHAAQGRVASVTDQQCLCAPTFPHGTRVQWLGAPWSGRRKEKT
jgi:hypothetical protein